MVDERDVFVHLGRLEESLSRLNADADRKRAADERMLHAMSTLAAKVGDLEVRVTETERARLQAPRMPSFTGEVLKESLRPIAEETSAQTTMLQEVRQNTVVRAATERWRSIATIAVSVSAAAVALREPLMMILGHYFK